MYQLPSSRKLQLEDYFKAKQFGFKTAHLHATTASRWILKNAGKVLGIEVPEWLLKLSKWQPFAVVTAAITHFIRLESKAEKDRIAATYNYYSRINSHGHKQWHTQPLTALESTMAKLQKELSEIEASTDRAKRRYFPARLHMLRGVQKIILDKKRNDNTANKGDAGVLSLDSNLNKSLALAALYFIL